ncbi:hypothetical protein D3C71_2181090 [compost metagenome]
MTYRDMLVTRVAGRAACPEQQGDIHHAINNGPAERLLPVPRTNKLAIHVEAACEEVCRLQANSQTFLIAR